LEFLIAMPQSEKSDQKLTRSETITALTHYYRGEVARSLAWRARLDHTTNWAVGAAAALLGFSFSHPEIHHSLFYFALALIYVLLYVEARRYRFYDAYEYRVRLLHQNFIYGVLTGRLEIEEGSFWQAELASDLKYPQYKMDLLYALGRRLHANYIYLFSILLTGWLVKIKLHPLPARSWRQYYEQASLGIVPGWVTFLFILVFAVHMLVLIRVSRKPRGGRDIFYPGFRPAAKEKDMTAE
jgi:uncharacterized membrane protein